MTCRWRRLLEQALLTGGTTCLAVYGLARLDEHRFQAAQVAAFHEVRTTHGHPESTPGDTRGSAALPAPPATGALIGILEVPRLQFSTPVVEGDDDATLRRAAGHLPDTPLPWRPGNSAFAGHRDAHFRPLKDVAVGDDVWLRTPHGDIRYRVTDTGIVTPEDLSVLAPREGDAITLITCYPFSFVGRAPRRFIVHADRQ